MLINGGGVLWEYEAVVIPEDVDGRECECDCD